MQNGSHVTRAPVPSAAGEQQSLWLDVEASRASPSLRPVFLNCHIVPGPGGLFVEI